MSKAWDRLADATAPAAGALSVITLGEVAPEALTPLTAHFAGLEQLVLDVSPRDELSKHRGEFNRAVDAASHDWLLVLREREVIVEPLAAALAQAAAAGKARGFRLRVVPYYAGRPLRLGGDDTEIRLFHRRYYLRYANKGEWQHLAIQGTVVRLPGELRSITFASTAEHLEWLERTGRRRSPAHRIAAFLRDVLASRTLDRNTLRYIWTAAGFDRA